MRHARKVALLAGLSLLALSGAAQAQTTVAAGHDADKDAAGQPVIVITGSGYRVQKDALMSHVDVLTRAQIDEKPAQGLGDMLAYMPGIRSSSFAPGASRPMIRGLDGFRVLVLNNGMGVVDVSALSPDHAVPSNPTEARRIEVLRGPSALAYGGNAIGGIVNIIDDRIPGQAPAKGYEGTLAVQGSTVDSGLQGALNVKAGKGPWVVTLDAFKHTAGDYDVPVPPELGGADTRRQQTNAAQDMRNLGAGVSYIGNFGYAGISYKTTDYLYGVAIEPDVEIDLHQVRWDARGQFNLAFAGFNRLDAQAGYSDYDHAEIEDGDIGTQFLSKGSEFRLAFVRDGQGPISGTVGVTGLKRDFQAIGDEAFVPSTTTKQAGIFTQYRYDSGNWGVEGGARFDTTDLTSAAFARDFNTVSGSLGAFYRPSDHAFTGLSLTRSERAPSDVELLADGPHVGTGQFIIGNAAFTTEVGYSLELASHIVIDHDNGIAIDSHLYTSHFDNFIDLAATGATEDGLPVFQYVQTDADLYGLELEATAELLRWKTQSVKLNLAYDYVHGQTALGPVVRMPPQALTLKLSSEGGGWNSYVEVRGVDARKRRLAALETPTDGYVTVNLFTSYKLPHMAGTSVFAELRNATDAAMREATSATKDFVVGPGRSLRVGLTWNF